MFSKNWHIVKDDTKKTFEVCGMTPNDNGFINKVIAMQRAGLNVSWVTPPVTNRTSSKEMIKFTGYTREDGLFDRLFREMNERNKPDFTFDEDIND